MIPLTTAQIAEITGGTLNDLCDPNTVVTGTVEFDSRKLTPGGLFVALKGERVDGHDFAHAAWQQGAAAVLAFNEVDAPAIMVPKVEQVSDSARGSYALAHDTDGEVASVLAAMGKLARYVVQHTEVQVVGVTGSAGKTSTKDMLATILRTAGNTVAPPGSFNNEIGHPYTALRVQQDTQYLVAELSARGLGHVAHLAQIAPPKVGVVLNVGSAHLGEFGSREVIAQAKGELVEALPAEGTAVLNMDDPLVWAMRSRTAAETLSYGTHAEADVRASNITLKAGALAAFTLEFPDAGGHRPTHQVELQVAGEHQVSNALAAAAAAFALGLEPQRIAAALSAHVAASAHRMAVRSLGSVTLIDDAYNANPESMRAGLRAARVAAGDKGKVIAVLGPMGELGADADREHAELGAQLAGLGVEVLVAVGAPHIAAGARAAARSVTVAQAESNAQAAQQVLDYLGQAGNDVKDVVVLAKASNAAALWEVTDLLAEALAGQGIGRQGEVTQ